MKIKTKISDKSNKKSKNNFHKSNLYFWKKKKDQILTLIGFTTHLKKMDPEFCKKVL